jgi:hypothetical protein
MAVRLPNTVLVAAILLSAATAFVLESITQPAASDAAGGSSAVVSQLKTLNQKMGTVTAELADVNTRLGTNGDVMGFLHDIERHTKGTCEATNKAVTDFSSDCSTIYSSRLSH